MYSTYYNSAKRTPNNLTVYYDGDAKYDSADAVTVSIDNIYGKTVLKVPKIGYVRKELTNPIVLSVCLVLPLIIIIFINFRPRRDYIDVLE